jgi:KipI family sensor histidine kinase inhibitor
MTIDQIVALHSGAEHVVRFLGFAPGFAYIAGLPTALVVPRLDSPRVRVPAGSVGIAADRTGIYPREGPGGWRLIGRTPLKMFDVEREPAALLRAGDRVRFVPIDEARFRTMDDGSSPWPA